MLKLPLGKVLELVDCYYMPKLIRNIILVSLLFEHGFKIEGKGKARGEDQQDPFLFDFTKPLMTAYLI